MPDIHSFSYTPSEGEDTCKEFFDFELEKKDGAVYIRNLSITGEPGCVGHPKSLCILLKGRDINKLPIEELKAAGCNRNSSCGQELSKALKQLQKDLKIQTK